MAAAAWDLGDSSARPGLLLTVHMPGKALQSEDKRSGRRAGGAVGIGVAADAGERSAAAGGAGGAGVRVGGEDEVHYWECCLN